MRFSSLDAIMNSAKNLGLSRVAVAAAADKDVLEAVKLAQDEGLVEPILFGDMQEIQRIATESGLKLKESQIIHAPNQAAAANAAVDAVVDGQAHFLMKGLVNSADFLRAVLRSERGLRTGRLLSHIGAFEVKGLSRLLFITDGGINIAPDLAQKKEILQSSLDFLHRIGMNSVNVAVLAANEVPNAKMQAAMDALALTEINQAGEFAGAVVEGPLALDGAISAKSLKQKGIKSKINGEADLFLAPTIEVGNVFAKSLVYFAGATMAGIILGAKVPIVLTSRSDTPRSKLMSLALAALSRQSLANHLSLAGK